MIRKDKVLDKPSDESLEKRSSEDNKTVTVHDLETRALSAFSDTEDLNSNE